jgi:hypothetical protein
MGRPRLPKWGIHPSSLFPRALFITENTNPEIQDIIIVRRIDEAMPLEPKAPPLTGVNG